MEGMHAVCKVLGLVVMLVALYGVWMANFGGVATVGSTEGSVSIIAFAVLSWGCHKGMDCCGGMKK